MGVSLELQVGVTLMNVLTIVFQWFNNLSLPPRSSQNSFSVLVVIFPGFDDVISL